MGKQNKGGNDSKLLTSIEARQVYEYKKIELENAKKELLIAELREQDIENLKITLKSKDNQIHKLKSEIDQLNKIEKIKDYKVLEEWGNRLHSHLISNELINDEDLDLLFQDIEKLIGKKY